MSDMPKLLTEAQWREQLASVPDVETAIAALDNAGLIAEPVDPLLIEAREIVITHGDWVEPRRVAASVRAGNWDCQPTVMIALAALKRGMELARPTLTREMVRDAVAEALTFGDMIEKGDFDLREGMSCRDYAEAFIDRLHTALTEALNA